MWLLIETACFYLYVTSAILFVLWRQLISVCARSVEISDMYKSLTDFIVYSAHNLTWFAINFVCCTMPLVCLFLLVGPHNEIAGAT